MSGRTYAGVDGGPFGKRVLARACGWKQALHGRAPLPQDVSGGAEAIHQGRRVETAERKSREHHSNVVTRVAQPRRWATGSEPSTVS